LTTQPVLVSALYNHGQVFGLFERDYDPKKAEQPAVLHSDRKFWVGILPEAPLTIATGLNAADEARERGNSAPNLRKWPLGFGWTQLCLI
jgi:hypothetical protein